MARDTICALASGSTPSAIAIIRISGPDTSVIGSRMVVGGLGSPRYAKLAELRDASGDIVDKGLALFMPGPASYTGEDVLELFLHGGAGVVEHALDCLMEFGARLAEPGEFTRRAFEAGNLDLVEAEGVADLIDAETRAQKDQALRQLSGALSQVYDDWRSELLECLALLEASIDFPDEEDAPEIVSEPVALLLRGLHADIERALQDGQMGERVRDGFRVAIIGKPNAGKSTLLNRLAKRDAAIVTDRPGTTRDVIEVRTVLAGQIVWIADTAGIRESDDVIEQEGVLRARATAETADLRVFLKEVGDDFNFPGLMRDGDLLVTNKVDLASHTGVPSSGWRISAMTGAGVHALEDEIASIISRKASGASPLITRARHRSSLEAAAFDVGRALEFLSAGAGNELVSEHVRLASRALSNLVGTIGVEDVLGSVFSSFCIGK